MERWKESIWMPATAAFAVAGLTAGCVLAPRGTREERTRALAAGAAWEAPVAERTPRPLLADAGWRALLAHAFHANGGLEAAYFEWRAALARVQQAASYPNTNVALGFQYLFSDAKLKAWDRTTLSLGVDPMQNLSFPTKVMAAGRVAFDDARAAGARFADAKFTLQRRVLDAWLDWALLAERLRLQRTAVALLEVVRETSAGRLAAGGEQRALLAVEVEAGTAENALRRLESEVPGQRALLNALVGRAPDAPLDLPSALPEPRPLPADDARLLALGGSRSPALAALAHEVAGRRDALALARQQYIPDVNPFAAATGGMEQLAGVMLSLPARIPMIRGAIEEARVALRRAEAMARQEGLDRDARFVAALAALRDSEREAAFLTTRVVAPGERALGGTRDAYATGSLGLPELLDAERALLEVHAVVAEARTARERRLAELEELAGADVETLAGEGGAS